MCTILVGAWVDLELVLKTGCICLVILTSDIVVTQKSKAKCKSLMIKPDVINSRIP